jgi:hypothetical protein
MRMLVPLHAVPAVAAVDGTTTLAATRAPVPRRLRNFVFVDMSCSLHRRGTIAPDVRERSPGRAVDPAAAEGGRAADDRRITPWHRRPGR